ncbi:hypothetical protein BH23ACT9_BH23ACT9_32970 [soil metagenome]
MTGEQSGRTGRRLRGVLGVLGVVALVGVVARSPTTVPDPTPPTPTAATAVPDAIAGTTDVDRAEGTWTTATGRVPARLRQGPTHAVWTGRELVVGFTPDTAAYAADRTPGPLWRRLPPHTGGALEVRGATQVRGAEVFAYGARTCRDCPWEPVLHALDPNEAAWQRLPDAPGGASGGHEAVVSVANELVVVRDTDDGGLAALAYDPRRDEWRDLDMPPVRPLGWRAIGAGDQLVLVGTIAQPGGGTGPGALVLDLPSGAWRNAGRGMPLRGPELAAAVWTGDAVVFFGSPTSRGAPRGAVLSLTDDTWTALPAPSYDLLAEDDAAVGDLDGELMGLAGVWDGDRALFVGGLTTPVFLAWSPDEQRWQVRPPPTARAGATAVWTGQQVLLWGGVTRDGRIADLQVYTPDGG